MKKVLLLSSLCCLTLAARATHLLGGEIFARNTSGLTYEISGILYANLQNGSETAQSEITLCLGDGTTVTARRVSSEKLSGNSLVTRSTYRVVHTYAAAGNYTITSRLDQLSGGSVVVPGGGGQQPLLVLQTILNTTLPNTTATASDPRFFSGLREVFNLPLAKTDPDGDSLAYRIVRLLDQPQDCTPTSPSNTYVFPNEVAREGTFKIDFPKATLIWNAPSRLGFYTYAYVTEEWRRGRKVAESWRTYALIITDQNSTSNPVPTFEPVMVDFSGVVTALPSQEFVSSEISLKIYPVPSTETITVEVNTPRPSTARIEMVDLQGRILQKADYKDLSSRRLQEFKTGNLAKGVYLIRVQSDEAVLTRKFVR